jgi:UDP-N-acetylglucosamine 3-dehydrogenase
MTAAQGRLRVGVVGLGSWGLEHLRAWVSLPWVEVVAVCDRDERLCRRVGESFGIPRTFGAAADMAAAGELDAVSIAGAERDRFETAAPFFDAGVHALVEKPLALDLATAERLVAAAQAAGVILMTGHVLRFDPRFAGAKQRVDAGAVGELRSVYSRRLNLASAQEKYRRAHPALMAQIHDIDLACWYFGDRPTAVRAYEQDGSSAPGVLWSVLEFPQGIAVLEHAWVLPDAGGIWLESETELIGTDGVLRIRTPGDAVELLTIGGSERPDPAVAAIADGHPATALKEQLSYFASCVIDRRSPRRLTADDGLRALATAFGVIEAARTGTEVQLFAASATGKTNSA